MTPPTCAHAWRELRETKAGLRRRRCKRCGLKQWLDWCGKVLREKAA